MIHRIALILTLALTLFCTPGLAQTARDSAASYTELNPDPTRIESIGLSINLPIGVEAKTVQYGSSTSTAVELPDGLGVLIIKEQHTNSESLDLDGVISSIENQLVRTHRHKVLSRDDKLLVGLWRGRRLYAVSPQQGVETTYRGVTVFNHKPQSFLIFDLTTKGTGDTFFNAQRMYETIIATMDLQAVSNESVKRVAGFKATETVLDQLSIEDYDAVLTGRGNERWERLHTPARTGEIMDDTEHGYRRIRTWSGYKGELTGKDRTSWSPDDRTLGYLVQIDAMAFEPQIRIDSRSIFFMALDDSEETWTIRMTLTQDENKNQSTVTGARSGDSLTVTTTHGSNPPIVIKPTRQSSGYLSQVQTYLFGAILVQKQLIGDFASYAYNSTTNTVALRWDTVSRPDGHPDHWLVTTKTSSDAPPTKTHYNKDGELVKVTLSNGRVWEPIELDELLALWKKKGLPLN